MDGENNEKALLKWMIFGGKPPIFGRPPMTWISLQAVTFEAINFFKPPKMGLKSVFFFTHNKADHQTGET